MFSTKRSVMLVVTSALALVVGFGFSAHATPSQAQDDMALVTCDSTLVTLLYIAEHDYEFNSMYDVSMLDKGQYAPLFEAMMAMMESDEMMEATPEGEMMESTTEEDMMDDMMTVLTPGTVEGEDQFCTDLRAELDGFFYATLLEATMTE